MLYKLQQKGLVYLTEEEYNAHIAKVINNMHDHLYNEYGIDNFKVYIKDKDIKVDVNINDYPLENVYNLLNEINNVLKEYKKHSKRNDYAELHGKIAKHSMHLLRLYMMGIDILTEGKIITYREKEHDLLMDIRLGKYLGEDGKPNKEFFEIVKDYENRFDIAKEKSELPDEVDKDAIADLKSYINDDMVHNLYAYNSYKLAKDKAHDFGMTLLEEMKRKYDNE
jgi:hypothetical protein